MHHLQPPTPYQLLKIYLGISLDKEKPYLNVKISHLMAQKYPKDKPHKINKQTELLLEVIRISKSNERLPTFQSESPKLIHSSSSESLTKADDEFLKHLNIKCQKNFDSERTKEKIKHILCIFQSLIADVTRKDRDLEKFHRKTFSAALEFHQNLFFNPLKPYFPAEKTFFVKPLPQRNTHSKDKFSLRHPFSSKEREIPIIESRHSFIGAEDEEFDAMRSLKTTTIDKLYSYWYASFLENGEQFDFSIIPVSDQSAIKDYNLLKISHFSKALKVSVISEFTTQELRVLAEDLNRQTKFIQVKTASNKLYKIKQTKSFEEELEEFWKFIIVLIDNSSILKEDEKLKEIYSKLEELKKEQKTFGEIYTTFLQYLSHQNAGSLAQKLLNILLYLSQKTYMLPALTTLCLFPHFNLKWGKGSEYRSILYSFVDEPKLESSIKTVYSKSDPFELIIKTNVICNFDNVSKSTSEIIFEIPYHSADKIEAKKFTKETLENLGFKVIVFDKN